jgi:hypothetical protein
MVLVKELNGDSSTTHIALQMWLKQDEEWPVTLFAVLEVHPCQGPM